MTNHRDAQTAPEPIIMVDGDKVFGPGKAPDSYVRYMIDDSRFPAWHGRMTHYDRALTPDDAKAALEAYGRKKVREGMRLAAGLIAKRRDDYISEYGIYDPTTGVTEFPGNGDEYVSELDDCEAAILADMEKLK